MAYRHVRPVTAEQISRMTTTRKDAYRRRMLELQDAPDASDAEEGSLQSLDPELIYFKDDPRWAPLLASVRGAATGPRQLP